MHLSERYRGSLLGLAAGDALGTTLEFRPPGTFEALTDLIGGGPFNLLPGQWTDDTSMALCLAESLIERRGFDPQDQLQRYVRWYRHGYLSSTGQCFDIGNTVRSALHRFEQSAENYPGSTDPRSAGNGSLMRLAPVVLFYANQPEQAIKFAGLSSRTTHGASAAVDACRYFAGLLLGALQGLDKNALLAPAFTPIPGLWELDPLVPEITAVAAGSFLHKQPPEIQGSGYVVRSLEAALWAFAHTPDYKTGALAAVNLGDDADTSGAIYGQLAGAYYGESGIPAGWRTKISAQDEIRQYADQLLALAGE